MTRNKEIIRLSFYGIFINIVLSSCKAIIGFLTNSIAILLDAVNNLSDTLSASITIIGTKLSSKEPDKEHPYGHGRIEYMVSVLIAVIVMFAGVSSLKKSIEKIINPTTAKYSLIPLLIIMTTVFVKLIFGIFIKNRGKSLRSNSLVATGIDAIGDSIVTLSTFVAAIISIYFKINIEGYVGILISLMILKSSFEILKESLIDMIGIGLDEKLEEKIKNRILTYDDVLDVHDICLHNYGPNSIVATAYIDVAEDMMAKEIYRLTTKIVADIASKYSVDITLGIYASNDNRKYRKLENFIAKLINDYETVIDIHGFYVDDDLKEVSFDIIFDYDEENTKGITTAIRNKLRKEFPEYKYSITVDKGYEKETAN